MVFSDFLQHKSKITLNIILCSKGISVACVKIKVHKQNEIFAWPNPPMPLEIVSLVHLRPIRIFSDLVENNQNSVQLSLTVNDKRKSRF